MLKYGGNSSYGDCLINLMESSTTGQKIGGVSYIVPLFDAGDEEVAGNYMG